jgi:hypothetical protein
MSAMGRRIERLEQEISPDRYHAWCCTTEGDAQALIARLRTEHLTPPLLFIAGQPNSDGSLCWRIEGKSVAELWRAIDRFDPEPPRVEPVSPEIDSRAGEHMTDEQLLGVIAQTGATLVMHRNGNSRLIEAGESL